MSKQNSLFSRIKGFFKRILKKVKKNIPGPDSISMLDEERTDFVREQMMMDIENSKRQSGIGM